MEQHVRTFRFQLTLGRDHERGIVGEVRNQRLGLLLAIARLVGHRAVLGVLLGSRSGSCAHGCGFVQSRAKQEIFPIISYVRAATIEIKGVRLRIGFPFKEWSVASARRARRCRRGFARDVLMRSIQEAVGGINQPKEKKTKTRA